MTDWEADVYQGDRLVARIERTATGSRLEFDSQTLDHPPSYPGRLAWQIPYAANPVVQLGYNLHPFFVNLLPEGARLDILLSGSRIARDDFLGLLLKVGWDTIGDVTVVPHGGLPPSLPNKSKTDPGEMRFAALLSDTSDSLAQDAALPGVQDKLSSAMFSMPIQTRTWPAGILKLNPRRYPLLVQNEAFFLQMAASCGVSVCSAKLVTDSVGEPGLLVRRFDRVRTPRAKKLLKLHQEDACQLLGQFPENKYHLSLQQIARVFEDVCTAPVVEIRRLINLYAFSYLIGNADMHGKNISLIWNQGSVTISPAYDLPSSLPYKQLDPRMAIKLDGKDDNFRESDFVRFGARFSVSERAIIQDLKLLHERSGAWIDRLHEIGFSEPDTSRMQVEIGRRRDRIAPS